VLLVAGGAVLLRLLVGGAAAVLRLLSLVSVAGGSMPDASLRAPTCTRYSSTHDSIRPKTVQEQCVVLASNTLR
jgi:hypothetical protein